MISKKLLTLPGDLEKINKPTNVYNNSYGLYFQKRAFPNLKFFARANLL